MLDWLVNCCVPASQDCLTQVGLLDDGNLYDSYRKYSDQTGRTRPMALQNSTAEVVAVSEQTRSPIQGAVIQIVTKIGVVCVELSC